MSTSVLARVGAILIGLGALSSGAQADVIYTSAAAFSAATQNPVFIGFNGFLAGPTDFADVTGGTLNGVTANSGTAGVNVNLTGSAYYGPGFTYAADYLVGSAGGTGPKILDISFANPVSALSLNFGSLFFGSTTLTLSNGTTVTNNAGPIMPNTQFLGFVTSSPITGFTLSTPTSDDSYVLLDLTLAAPLPAPEPVTLSLFGAGVAGAIVLRRRKKA